MRDRRIRNEVAMRNRGASAFAFAMMLAAATTIGRTAEAESRLTWLPGSTTKVEQLIGDCDYSLQAATGQCVPTTSRTNQRFQVLGTDLGSSFESQGKLIFLFGDTIGSAENYFAADTMASTSSTDATQGLLLDFFSNSDGTPFFIRVPGIRMGAGEVPEAGVRLDGVTYIACKSG